MKRFNKVKAEEITLNIVNNTKFDYTQHQEIQMEARKAIYDYFGWTKSSVNYVNIKMLNTLVKSGKLIPRR